MSRVTEAVATLATPARVATKMVCWAVPKVDAVYPPSIYTVPSTVTVAGGGVGVGDGGGGGVGGGAGGVGGVGGGDGDAAAETSAVAARPGTVSPSLPVMSRYASQYSRTIMRATSHDAI